MDSTESKMYRELLEKRGHPLTFTDVVKDEIATTFGHIRNIFPHYTCTMCGRNFLTPERAKACCPHWRTRGIQPCMWIYRMEYELTMCPICLGRKVIDGKKCWFCTGHGNIPTCGAGRFIRAIAWTHLYNEE